MRTNESTARVRGEQEVEEVQIEFLRKSPEGDPTINLNYGHLFRVVDKDQGRRRRRPKGGEASLSFGDLHLGSLILHLTQ